MAIYIKEKSVTGEINPAKTLVNYAQARDLFDRFGMKIRHRSIQSDNYSPAVSGWIIRANGTIEALDIIAGSYIQTFVEALANIPTSIHIGDLWIRTDENNKIYRAACVGADEIAPGEWVKYGTLANWSEIVDDDGGKPANNATEGADWDSNLTNIPSSLFQVFYAANAPETGMVTGDYWIDSDDNKIYRYTGAAWGDVQDNDIGAAIAAAAAAQSTADGKIKVFRQTDAPTAEGEGDIWFDSDDGDRPYYWDGAQWVDIQDG